jgi:hypothetical protein
MDGIDGETIMNVELHTGYSSQQNHQRPHRRIQQLEEDMARSSHEYFRQFPKKYDRRYEPVIVLHDKMIRDIIS